MTVPQRLTRQLERALGDEAAEDLVNLLDGVELQRSEMRAFRESMRADFAEFRESMRAEFSAFREDMHKQVAAQNTIVAALSARIESVKSDLMKWSLLFWTGAVIAIAALAGLAR